MISIAKLSVHYSARYLFKEISFLINHNDHIGLTGKNGAGKSTLLKIISGLQEPDEGEIAKPNGLTVGYLPQEMEHQGGKTVFEEALTAFGELLELQNKINHLTDEVSHRTDTHTDAYMDLLNDMHDASERFSMMGGYDMESEVEKVLLGLGFMRTDFVRKTDEFSGGWRMRIELAKILLQKPQVILLDEPTNHLDIESIQWLEEFLKTYTGAIVLVSHDKIFLDMVTNRTIEIVSGKIDDYKANYSRYLELREERKTLQKASYDNQQKEIEHLEKFVERFKAKASKATQAQSRVKALEKIERIEIDEEDNAAMRFRFPEPPRAGAVVVESKDLSKSYGPKHVLDHLEFEIARGEKIAFVGKNGEGKSTLSRILAGLENYTGTLNIGYNVHIGYHAQNQADVLNGEKTVFQTIDDEAAGEMRTKVRALLGAFLFSGESVDKKVKVLSGGEKSRLALAKLLLEPINLLIMDEPTNHLDMRSKEILKDALINYTGTLVIVSHDRDFLQGLTQKVFEFRNKGVKEHIGDVYEYLKSRKIENLSELEKKKKDAKDAKEEAVVVKEVPKLSFEEKKQLDREINKLEKQISTSESKIEELEKKKADTENKLSDPANLDKQSQLLAMYEADKKELDKELKKWEDAIAELENLKK